ncbi:MAG: hypothetical protein NUV91_08605 [Candidatus Omnitrophica bacterium]|nr:hypothetical protein [Candidatus Omnitrophota bacterium]
MKKVMVAAVGLILSVTLFSCGPKPAANSQEAIATSKTKGSVEQQAEYLVGQAKNFLRKENYDEAIQTANYVLINIDQTSAEAQAVIAQAQQELQKVAQKKMDELQKQANKTMDDMKQNVKSWE